MLIDIEDEYNEFVRDRWKKFSTLTKDILKFRKNPDRIYNIISQRSIQFLQKKLKLLHPAKSDTFNRGQIPPPR